MSSRNTDSRLDIVGNGDEKLTQITVMSGALSIFNMEILKVDISKLTVCHRYAKKVMYVLNRYILENVEKEEHVIISTSLIALK